MYEMLEISLPSSMIVHIHYQSNHRMEMRSGEKFVVKKAKTERYKKSAIPCMQRLLNDSEKEKLEIFKTINSTVPVNYEFL